jgi:hypothetical protein
MSPAAAQRVTRPQLQRSLMRGAAAIVALIAMTGLLGLLMPLDTLLRSWLVAFAIWSGVPIGSMLLLLIHRLTGGDWGRASATILRPAAALMPIVAVGFLPILCGLPHVYPWAAQPATIPADVARWYLNGPSFSIRSLIALGGWSLLGIVFATGTPSRLFAALGLAFFGLSISMVGIDWYLSLQPRYTSSAFAAMIAVQHLLAALAFLAVVAPPMIEGKVAGDLGALLIAALLGTVYLAYMQYVVAWYGDLPDKAAWYLARSGPVWRVTITLAFAVGAAVPFLMLLIGRIRHSRHGLRAAGVLILGGIGLHLTWLLLPAFSVQFGPAAVACIVLAGVVPILWLTGFSLQPDLSQMESHHAG